MTRIFLWMMLIIALATSCRSTRTSTTRSVSSTNMEISTSSVEADITRSIDEWWRSQHDSLFIQIDDFDHEQIVRRTIISRVNDQTDSSRVSTVDSSVIVSSVNIEQSSTSDDLTSDRTERKEASTLNIRNWIFLIVLLLLLIVKLRNNHN